MGMKLVYKIGGIGLAGGASVGAYLLIPSSKTVPEEIIQNSEPLPAPAIASNRGAWQKDFKDQGYAPILFSNTSDIDFLGLSEAYAKANDINELSEAQKNLANLCNSFNEREDLDSNDKAKAKRWCFKPRTVEDILKSRKRKPVYKIEEVGYVWSKEKVKALARKYMENVDEKLKMVVSSEEANRPLVIQDGDLNGDLSEFTKACGVLFEGKSYEDKLDEKIDKATNWCTEEVVA